MKNLVTIIALLFTVTLFAQDQLICVSGSAKSGEGILKNTEETIFKAGIFNNEKLNGAGYKKEKNGNFYFSNFKDDLPTGFSVYFIGEGVKQHGVFKNGLKEGVHVLMFSDLTKYDLITYQKDKEISRKNITVSLDKLKDGCQGDCENGFGFKADGPEILLLGFFKNNAFIRGEIINIPNNSSEFYDFENKEKEKGMYISSDTENGFIEEYIVIDYFESKNINKQKSSTTVRKETNSFIVVSFDEQGNLKNKINNF